MGGTAPFQWCNTPIRGQLSCLPDVYRCTLVCVHSDLSQARFQDEKSAIAAAATAFHSLPATLRRNRQTAHWKEKFQKWEQVYANVAALITPQSVLCVHPAGSAAFVCTDFVQILELIRTDLQTQTHTHTDTHNPLKHFSHTTSQHPGFAW